jgi:uncharacterized membrane protein
MDNATASPAPAETTPAGPSRPHPLRFHLPNAHLWRVFGNDGFALIAESVARYFGTPGFLLAQTVIVVAWMTANVLGIVHFDVYPFILLNLAFSLQAAYAAPLILLAQTRQADRDKALAEADANHREALAHGAEQRQIELARQAEQLAALLRQNTALTKTTRELTLRIEALTRDVHERLSREPALGIHTPARQLARTRERMRVR